jgi:hypothetical protein
MTIPYHAELAGWSRHHFTVRGALRRAFEAIVDSRQRQADRAIALFISEHGGFLSDEVERRLMERFSAPAFGPTKPWHQ